MPLSIRLTMNVPKVFFDISLLEQRIINALWDVGSDAQDMFVETVETWNNWPEFTKTMYEETQRLRMVVGTSDPIYSLVNKGAPMHPIYVKNAGTFLRFQNQYTPKSQPGSRSSFSGGKSGYYISTRFVEHPGFKAREFDKQIAHDIQDEFTEKIQAAMKP
jgi:hypothetical protein